MLELFPDKPEQAIYRLLENLCTKDYLEIHKKIPKGATKGNNKNIPMNPKELQEIRGNKKYP